MRNKISMLIAGIAMMGTTLVLAAPEAATPKTTPQPAAISQASQPLPWELQAKTACNLLCIQGYHCCVSHNQPTCIPDTQACK
jgi:hypothetical protein